MRDRRVGIIMDNAVGVIDCWGRPPGPGQDRFLGRLVCAVCDPTKKEEVVVGSLCPTLSLSLFFFYRRGPGMSM